MFDAMVYHSRRLQLVTALKARGLGNDLILLIGNDEEPYTFADNPYPFRQDSSILYYIGIAEPGLAVLIDMDSGETRLVRDTPSLDEMIWTNREASQLLAQQCGAQHVIDHANLERWLRQQRRTVHTLPAWKSSQRERLARLMDNQASVTPSIALIACVVEQREVKSEAELAEIESALTVTAAMHERAREFAAAEVQEWQVLAAMEEIATRARCRMAYLPICTRDGQVLHHNTYENTLRNGDLLLIDAGVESHLGYASDITRTHCIGGQWSDVQILMRETVSKAQSACAAAARPGVPMADIHRLAAFHIVEGLSALRLFRGSTEAVLASGAYALVFPHGVGHLLGLDVHDMEALGEDLVGYDAMHARDQRFGVSSLRLGKPLREGMTITIEPGIYFIPLLLRKWMDTGLHRELINVEVAERLMGTGGLRIEDNYVIETRGARRLGPGFIDHTSIHPIG